MRGLTVSASVFTCCFVLAIFFTVMPASATPWSFGMMADTQWSGTDPTGNNINSVAVNQVKACNQAFVNAGVDFVVQVGDLDNDGSTAGMQTRLNANSLLTANNIAYYALRGNHDDNSSCKTFFQSYYIPTSSPNASVAVATDGISYSVTHNDTKVILLDILTADSTSAMDAATTWVDGQLKAADHTQAFVFSHKNLLGQNHKDNEFGSSNDANPTQQNAFFAALQNDGVRYVISGHDHLHHRSIVTSPDGQHKLQEIISASDSYKYYTPSSPYSTRETPINQELYQTGYYIYTVDGPRLTARYYSTTPLANGDVPANAIYSLRETFGYSLNGKEFLVAEGGSYTTVQDSCSGTIGKILGGINGNTARTYDGRNLTKAVDTGWSDITGKLASNILTLWGMSSTLGSELTDTYALSLSFDLSKVTDLQNFGLVTRNANGTWVKAGISFVTRAWQSGDVLGTYGVDLTANTAWAVVNHNGDFAVTANFTTVPLTISIGAPSAALTRAGPITYTITYGGADSVTLANANVTLNKTGTANGTVAVSGTGNTTRTVTISSITGTGTLGISIAAGTASDNDGNSAPAAGPSATFTVDNSPPVMAYVTDETYTTSTTTLSATWSGADPESGIQRYEYAVGTDTGTGIANTLGWTDAGTAISATTTELSLSVGQTYYISVRATNGVGLVSAPMSSPGVKVSYQVASIREAKELQNGKPVALPATLVVSAKFPMCFYLEDSNRVSGIRVQYGSSLTTGQTATVFGLLGLTAEGERAILSPKVISGPMGTPIQPLFVVGKAVGGGDLVMSGVTTPGLTDALGLNNIGLLVRMAGKVTKGVSDGFYLDDGVGPTDETNYAGIKIWTGVSGVSYENTYVVVTGPVSCRRPGTIVPQILARGIMP